MKATNTRLRKAKDPKKDELRAAEESYKRGVLIRGEAAKRGKGGKLPPGATHEIVGGEIRRVRYSAF